MYSVQVQTDLVPAIWNALPSGIKGSSSQTRFAQSPTDPTVGTLMCADGDEDAITQVLAMPNLSELYLQSYAANVRYLRQNGGIIFDNVSIKTDPASQNIIAGAVSLASLNSSLPAIDFKLANGWISLSAAEMIAIGQAVGTYVQSCFSAEKAVDAKIVSGTYTSTSQIDGASEWPSSTITTATSS